MTCPSLLWALLVSTYLGSSMAQTVTQSQQQLSVQEAQSVTLSCTYDISGSNYYLFWYKQPPSGEMIFIIRQEAFIQKNATENRFSVNFQPAAKSFSLRISDSQLGDAAMYFCALNDPQCVHSGGFKVVFGTGTRLFVEAIIQDPDPAVYQLQSPKSSNMSVCLFTDFNSQANVSQAAGSSVFRSGQTVLDMRTMDSKSNGALAWSDNVDFACNNIFEETDVSFNSGLPCDAKLVEKSFETDMNLNFQNLKVVGLRILLLKVAGFNLLMTLRLWSS
ncbi:T cell receptor alpha chain MC.7.G5-like [Orycteropus afer afer]|uniref:T cell receptor alpha chain MC.7.G5-like n=1 Tax=Orycteropus afer afer TaxID=1230840 RepID=UPI001C5CAEDE|nr:T cell receptor alpha chain MC.7.G5-like [Orycteropus afer afer]